MNKKNETYLNLNMNTDISQFNNKYHSPLNHNYTYYTLNTCLLSNNKNKFYANLKRNFTRNFLEPNYIYNQNKVMSLHRKINYNKNRKWKNVNKGNFSKNLILLHRNELRNKLLQSNIYQKIEKSANDNYIKEKRKKNMFITTIEEDNIPEEEQSNQTKKLFNTIKNNRKIELNTNSSFYYNESENKKNKINLNTINNNFYHNLSLKQLEQKESKSLDIYNLTDISLPCITFNSSLNSLNTDTKQKNRLAQTSLAKLRIEIINRVLHENYKTFFEKRDFPLSLSDTMLRLYLKNKQYFYIFGELNKKYMLFLTNEIRNNFVTLAKLIKQKEDLIKTNETKIKKISALEEKIKIYESFNNLYLNLKNKTKVTTVSKSPRKSIIKTKKISLRQTSEFFRKNSLFKKGNELFSKRMSHMKTISNPSINSPKKQKENPEIPKKARELFKNTQEIKDIFEEREKRVFLVYEKYVDLIYDISKLSLENKKEKQNNNPKIKENELLVEKLEKELILIKLRNRELNNYKNALQKSRINEENNTINKLGRGKIKESKILKKLKEIIFYHKLNTVKIPGMKAIFNILQEKEYTDCIIYKGKVYSKEIFYIKILEYMFLKIEEYKNKCLSDKNMREKYIQIKSKREKEMKYLKCEQNLMEENMNIIKKNNEIMNKNNKIIVLRNKKFDPFYKKYLKDEIFKEKKTKSKEEFDKKKQENENDIYNNYLYY